MSKEQVVNEIHKNTRKNFPRRHVVQKDIDDLWQADLIDLQFISKYNSGNNYILIIIDTFSKFAWAIPLKKKTKELVSKKFDVLLASIKRCPKNLQTDLGKEFYNEAMIKICKKYGINHYSTYSMKKASIVERLIRTIKSRLFKKFSLKGSYKWIDGTLKTVMDEYNHTKHSTIGITPLEVNDSNKKEILARYKRLFAFPNKNKNKLKVGDFVRISKYKGAFEKGYTANWSTEIFKIVSVKNTKPQTYLIEDTRHQPILGSFYAQELQKTKYPDVYLVEKVIKKQKNKVLVKWLGLPPSENSWIHKSNRL